MLTSDLVVARRRGDELKLQAWTGVKRRDAEQVAEDLLLLAEQLVGSTRDDLKEALESLPVEPGLQAVAAGLRKLIEDGCEFREGTGEEATALRTLVFEDAARLRREGEIEESQLRSSVAERAAATLAFPVEEFQERLFSDLRGAHELLKAPVGWTGPTFFEHWERSQRQAILLRSTELKARVLCREAAGYRRLFRALKFRRLLFRLSPHAAGGYDLAIEGPFHIFQQSTKYGLQLALLLSTLESCDEVSWEATVRWGAERRSLRFRWEVKGSGIPEGGGELPDELAALVAGFAELGSPWTVAPATQILNLPGEGVVVPDLTFHHEKGGPPVHLELLGFWSRDAVWRRVEWAEKHPAEPVLFAASSRLRVAEEVLDDVEKASLLVFKGALRARAVEKKLDELRAKAAHKKR